MRLLFNLWCCVYNAFATCSPEISGISIRLILTGGLVPLSRGCSVFTPDSHNYLPDGLFLQLTRLNRILDASASVSKSEYWGDRLYLNHCCACLSDHEFLLRSAAVFWSQLSRDVHASFCRAVSKKTLKNSGLRWSSLILVPSPS